MQFLQSAFIFKDLNDESLRDLLRFHRQETYQPGQAILRQGTRTDGLYLLINGEVDLSCAVKEERVDLYTLQGGCLIGEAELFSGEPRLVTARARSEATVVFWPRGLLLQFLEENPAALQRLKYASSSSRLACKRRFPWLAEGEIIHALTRRHPVHLVIGLIVPVVALAASVLLSIRVPRSDLPALLWVTLFLAVTGSAWTAWRILDYLNDFYILTNQRVIWLEKVIGVYDRRSETPLQWVLSTGISSGLLGRILQFGDVLVRTYTGHMELTRLPMPQFFIDMLEEQWQRLKQTQNRVDRESMMHTISERLASPEMEEELSLPEAPAEKNAETRIGLDQWSFRTRFETEGVISYRKHWAVLLRGLVVPLALLALAVIFIILRPSGMLPFTVNDRLLLYAVPVSLFFVAWIVYRYVDWANEIYQVTPTQIVDVHKKPLGQEIRRVAPLENILGTSVNQHGILGLLLNFGDVTAQVGTSEFLFKGVLNPNLVQQDIVRAQNAFLQRRSKKEQHQRQMEVVEWLSAYHEGTQSLNHQDAHPQDVIETQKENENDLTSRNHSGSGTAQEGPEAEPGNGRNPGTDPEHDRNNA